MIRCIIELFMTCLCSRPHGSCRFPTIPSFFPSHVFPALESKGPCLKSQVLHYLGVVENYKRFTTLGHYLKNVHWKKALKRVACLRLSSWWGVVAHIADLMENKPRHVGHNLCCIVSTSHFLRLSLLFSLLLNHLKINNVVLDLIWKH